MSASEMEPSRAAFLQSHVEVAEEEEEYTGKRQPGCRVVPLEVSGKTQTQINWGNHKA